jgi:hypothetical protein
MQGINLILGSGNNTVTLVNPTLVNGANFSIDGSKGQSDRLNLDFSSDTLGFTDSVTVNDTHIVGLGLSNLQ